MIVAFALYLASILSPLENVIKAILDFFHDAVGLPSGWSIVPSRSSYSSVSSRSQ